VKTVGDLLKILKEIQHIEETLGEQKHNFHFDSKAWIAKLKILREIKFKPTEEVPNANPNAT